MKNLAVTLIGLAATLSATACAEAPPRGVAQGGAVEVIKERDGAGRVRVRREVRIDTQGDYVNHGGWRAWDAAGQLVGQGRYAWGKPTGVWCRWAQPEDSPLLATEPFNGFRGPFLSQATFRDGKLEGLWSIFDTDGRTASEVHFRGGQRHGTAVQYLADGKVYRRARYEAGVPVGSLEQRRGDRIETLAEYESGRRRIERVERHDQGGGPRLREGWLGPAVQQVSADDPWRLRLAGYEEVGEEIRHGQREAWWPNGQRKLVAAYHLGQAVGEARWWHANGQMALRGSYEKGLATGTWSWWREDGARAAKHAYVAGRPVDSDPEMARR